jgi:hypothetical protein
MESSDQRAGERSSSGEALTPLEADLVEIWQDLLNREVVGVHDDFFELGGHSLLATDMLVAVEQLTGERIPDTALFEAPTVRLLAERIDQFSITDQPLVKLQDGSAPTPLFFCHGDYGGSGNYARRLASLLGPEQAVYAIAPPKTPPGEVPAGIEEVARRRLPIVLAAHPDGPVHLGGYCNGAFLDFEFGTAPNCKWARGRIGSDDRPANLQCSPVCSFSAAQSGFRLEGPTGR